MRIIRSLSLSLFVTGVAFASRAESTVLVPSQIVWNYTAATPGAWPLPNVFTADWRSGPTPIGYGDLALRTILTHDSAVHPITAYFQRGFVLQEELAFTVLRLSMRRDDGAVVYLNGTEVLRDNLPEGPVASDTLALEMISGPSEVAYAVYIIDPSALTKGVNIVTVEIHQAFPGSTDLAFDLELTGETDSPSPPAPHVLITSPGDGSQFEAGRTIQLGANAPTYSGGPVQTLEFFDNGAKIGNAEGPFATPLGAWLIAWSGARAGTHTLVARARDGLGQSSQSAPVTVFIHRGDTRPIVTIQVVDSVALELPRAVSMVDDAVFRVTRSARWDEPLVAYISVHGSATSGADFRALPESIAFPAGSSNTFIRVSALSDDLTEERESIVVRLQPPPFAGPLPDPYAVGEPREATAWIYSDDPRPSNLPPLVQMTTPTNGATVVSALPVRLEAVASDWDGLVRSVEFFRGTNSLGRARFLTNNTGPIYERIWSNPPPGISLLTARALDNESALTESLPVQIDGKASVTPLPRSHPADLHPADFALDIDEVTAYAAAWKHGTIWTTPPNPIPISYVTRAGALWKQGECYAIDPTQSPPICWTPCAFETHPAGWASSALRRPASIAPSVISRFAPASFVPNEPLDVVLTILPNTMTLAFAVEERIPAAWSVVQISSDGAWDPLHHKIKWGPFFDPNRRTLTYRLLPSAGAKTETLSGLGSFDGYDLATTGVAELSASCRLVPVLTVDGLRLKLIGARGSTFSIQTATQLPEWTEAAVVFNESGAIEFAAPPIPAPCGFYRATRMD